jgi:hypothetical protein
MSGTISPLPQYAFMEWYLVKHRDNFTTAEFDMLRSGKTVWLLFLLVKWVTGAGKVARFEVFTAMKIQVVVFWVVSPCNVVGYQRFGGPC